MSTLFFFFRVSNIVSTFFFKKLPSPQLFSLSATLFSTRLPWLSFPPSHPIFSFHIHHLHFPGDKRKNPAITKDVDILVVVAESESESKSKSESESKTESDFESESESESDSDSDSDSNSDY